jgi:hypothetical protein
MRRTDISARIDPSSEEKKQWPKNDADVAVGEGREVELVTLARLLEV